MLKKVIAVLVLLCCFCIGVSAESATVFTVNTAQEGETVTINVTTDKQTSVAGMDLILNYDSEYLTLKKDTLKCSLDDCVIATTGNSIRVLWDTVEEEKIAKVLISAEFENKEKIEASDRFVLTVNDYYEISQLADLPYKIEYKTPSSVALVAVNSFLTVILIVIGLILLSAVAYYIYINKKIEETVKKLIRN